MRTRTIALAILAVLVQSLGPVSPARAADPVVVTFNHTGAEQSFDVPVGITSIHVILIGGRGARTQGGSAPDRVEGDLGVTPSMRIYVEVGGDGVLGGTLAGSGAGGFNGGGDGGISIGFQVSTAAGGGGASDVRTLPRTDSASLGSRLMVAGGGGGAGFSQVGGDAGSPAEPPIGGAAGSSTAGGLAGSAPVQGIDGSLGEGGDGATMCNAEVCGEGVAGGGGGGGYYGGGGGGGGDFGGGGGGGSSFTGAATNPSESLADPASVPTVTITYEGGAPGSPSGTVDAIVTMASSAVCLELSTTAIDFGTRQFGEVGAPASPSIGVTNCSGVGEVILVRGSDATGPGQSAWSLVDFGACETGVLGTDKYRLRLESQAVPDVFVDLTTENDSLDALAGGATMQHEAQLDTPCPGSTGAGEVMSMQILFTAVEEVLP